MKGQHKSKLAATVILLRPAESNGFEVFLTRRPDEMAFLGGMYCFPGGALRKTIVRRRCCGFATVYHPSRRGKSLALNFRRHKL